MCGEGGYQDEIGHPPQCVASLEHAKYPLKSGRSNRGDGFLEENNDLGSH